MKIEHTGENAPLILGWREYVALPDLGIESIKAKVDTGARTSALHVTDLEYYQQNGKARVRFRVAPHQKADMPAIVGDAALVEKRTVRSSSGHLSERPVVRTTLRLRDKTYLIQISLVNRDLMGFRMLIGRTAIRRRYLVDPSRSYLGGIFIKAKK